MEMTIAELAATSAAAVDAAAVRGANGRVTELPDQRTIRYYSTIGLLDRPSGNRGRTALYGERHLLQLVAIKRLQAQGRTLAEIQTVLVGATEPTLRRIADITVPATRRAPSADRSRAFWSEPPATTADDLLYGVRLGPGVVLTLPGEPSGPDVEDIRTAARPLLELLAQRGLTKHEKGSAS